MVEVFEGIQDKDYDHEVDRAVAKAILPALAKALSPEELPDFYRTIQTKFKGDYNAYVDDIYDNSILSSRESLDKFLKKPTVKAIEKDPATAYSKAKNEKLKAVAMELQGLIADLPLLHKSYIRGLGEMKEPVPSYPDANFTLRLTYGNVKSYNPRDAIHYKYYTTTDGILQKENPEDSEFVAVSYTHLLRRTRRVRGLCTFCLERRLHLLRLFLSRPVAILHRMDDGVGLHGRLPV